MMKFYDDILFCSIRWCCNDFKYYIFSLYMLYSVSVLSELDWIFFPLMPFKYIPVEADKKQNHICKFIHFYCWVLLRSLALYCCNVLLSGTEGVKFCAVGELKGTGIHVAKPLLLWERGQTEEKETPLSPSLSHCPALTLSFSFP